MTLFFKFIGRLGSLLHTQVPPVISSHRGVFSVTSEGFFLPTGEFFLPHVLSILGLVFAHLLLCKDLLWKARSSVKCLIQIQEIKIGELYSGPPAFEHTHLLSSLGEETKFFQAG